jgi:hypothetical protein
MQNIDTSAATYAQAFLAAWNTRDAQARRSRLAALVAADVVYTDPHVPAPVTGRNAYLDFADLFRSRLPDIDFVSTGVSVTVYDILLRCTLSRPDGTTLSQVCFVFLRNSGAEANRILGFMEP